MVSEYKNNVNSQVKEENVLKELFGSFKFNKPTEKILEEIRKSYGDK
jgi:hypothetical protein